MLNPRQIEAFRAVMLTGGITSAAKLLNISQPAVSRLISDFQYAVKLTLFERQGTRFMPTSEAFALHQEVVRSFVGLERIARTAQDLRNRRAGLLRIASMPALTVGILPRFVGRFLQQRSKLDITVWGSSSPVVLDWVAAGQCEIGFSEPLIDHATVAAEKLPSVVAVAIVPRGHRLAAKPRLVPQDFAGEPFISLGESTLLRYRIDGVFADHGVARVLRTETQLSMIACGLVSSGAGLSIVDPFTAAEYVGRGVEVRPFDPAIGVEFAVLTSTQHPLSSVATEFIDEFRAEVAAFGRPEARVEPG